MCALRCAAAGPAAFGAMSVRTLVVVETRAQGAVSAATFGAYIRAAGGWPALTLVLVLFAVAQVRVRVCACVLFFASVRVCDALRLSPFVCVCVLH